MVVDTNVTRESDKFQVESRSKQFNQEQKTTSFIKDLVSIYQAISWKILFHWKFGSFRSEAKCKLHSSDHQDLSITNKQTKSHSFELKKLCFSSHLSKCIHFTCSSEKEKEKEKDKDKDKEKQRSKNYHSNSNDLPYKLKLFSRFFVCKEECNLIEN
jgi:hypothetical protein